MPEPQRNSGDLREFVARWKDGFGGGLVPFDTAYHDALRGGATKAEAQRVGVHALLDALVEAWEARR